MFPLDDVMISSLGSILWGYISINPTRRESSELRVGVAATKYGTSYVA